MAQKCVSGCVSGLMSSKERNAELINENRGMKIMKNRIESILNLDGDKQAIAKQSLIDDLFSEKASLKVVDVVDEFSSSPTLGVVLTLGDISARVHIKKSEHKFLKEYGTKAMNVFGEGYFEGHPVGLSHITEIVAYSINKERFCETVRDSANSTLKKLKINAENVASYICNQKYNFRRNGYGWENSFTDSKGNTWNCSFKGDEMDYDVKDCYKDYYSYNVFKSQLFENSEYYAEEPSKNSLKLVKKLFKIHKEVIASAIYDARVQNDEDFISKRMYLIENSPVFDIAGACGDAVNDNVRGAYAPNFTELDKIKRNNFIINQDAYTVCISSRNFRRDEYGSGYEGAGDWEMRKLDWKYTDKTLESLIDDFIITGWGQPENTSIRFQFSMLQDEVRRHDWVRSGSNGYRDECAFDVKVMWIEKREEYRYRETASEQKQRKQGWAIEYTPYDSHNGRSYLTHHAKTVVKKVIPQGMERLFNAHDRSIEGARQVMIENARVLMTENAGQTYIDNAMLGGACVHSRDEAGVYSVYVDASGNLFPLTDEEVMKEYLSKETNRGERNNPTHVRLLTIDTRYGDGETANLKLNSDYGYDVNAEVDNVKSGDAIAYMDALVKRLQDVDELLGSDITIK